MIPASLINGPSRSQPGISNVEVERYYRWEWEGKVKDDNGKKCGQSAPELRCYLEHLLTTSDEMVTRTAESAQNKGFEYLSRPSTIVNLCRRRLAVLVVWRGQIR
jgi:hypothetical protein